MQSPIDRLVSHPIIYKALYISHGDDPIFGIINSMIQLRSLRELEHSIMIFECQLFKLDM